MARGMAVKERDTAWAVMWEEDNSRKEVNLACPFE
jgi:hypothetical protein